MSARNILCKVDSKLRHELHQRNNEISHQSDHLPLAALHRLDARRNRELELQLDMQLFSQLQKDLSHGKTLCSAAPPAAPPDPGDLGISAGVRGK